MKHAFQDLIYHQAKQRQRTNVKSSSHDHSHALYILKILHIIPIYVA